MRHAVLLASLGALLAVAAAQGPQGPSFNPLAPGTATAHDGAELLAALDANKGNISLAADIYLQPTDWQRYALPINITAFNQTVLIYGGSPERVLDWGGAIGLLNIGPNSTLALDTLSSEYPGNRTRGVEMLPVEVKGSPLWPTVMGADGHKAAMVDMQAQIDIHDCNPAFVEIEVGRISKQLVQLVGPRGAGWVQYLGGLSVHYEYIPFPAPLFNGITKQQIGTAMYTLKNLTTSCYDSAPDYGAAPAEGGGLPTWAEALIGALAGCAGIALGALLLWWCWYRRRGQRQLAAADEERGSKGGSGADLASLPSGKLASIEDAPRDKLSRGGSASLSAQASGELQSPFLRTRFGPIDGVQLGELLGRGAYGRVYRGRWKGAIVAVKVIDHRVGPGKSCDLSREPLLSMSVSHPNVVITHKMCVVRVIPAGPLPDEGDAAQQAQQEQHGHAKQLSGRSGGSASSGSGGARLVPNLDGSGFVEPVSPHDVLEPGHYETWLITELCDRGSLADLVHAAGRLGGADASQRAIWALLCLLDVALGLEYLHSNTIIHGDLKPANVLLKAARNDRRGFICKLGDFGLSRMLGADKTHVDTQSYGTASYAAPELLSQGKLTKAADIYSLGLIMWEVAAGAEPYPDLTAMQVILQVSQHGLRPEVPASCPPALADLMQRCWAQDAAQRPQAAQVVEELCRQVQAMRLPAVAQGATPLRPPPPQQPAAAAAPDGGGGEGCAWAPPSAA